MVISQCIFSKSSLALPTQSVHLFNESYIIQSGSLFYYSGRQPKNTDADSEDSNRHEKA